MMSREEIEMAVQKFLEEGGEVTRLRAATEKDQRKARRNQYHRDKALAGSARSQKILEAQAKKETSFIFSKEERLAESS